MEKFAAAVTESKTPKSKLTDEMKDTLAGYWGSPWEGPRNQEVKDRWIESVVRQKEGQQTLADEDSGGTSEGSSAGARHKTKRPATYSRHDH